MSNLNELKRLESDLRASAELQKKLDEAVNRIKEEAKVESDGELMVAAAKELGYDISIAALEQAKAQAEQVDLDELEHVSGGADDWCWGNYSCMFEYHHPNEDNDGHNPICLTVWHCAITTLHTEGGTYKELCWENYRCWAFDHP